MEKKITSSSSPYAKPYPWAITLLLLPPSLLALSYLLPYSTDFRLPFIAASCRRPSPTPTTTAEPEFRLIIGIHTVPAKYHRRHILRLAYFLQQQPTAAPTARVDIRFILCNVTKEEDRLLVALEIMHHDDIIILNCTESAEGGKTYTYFSSLPAMFEGGELQPPYDYVMKTDDDTYLRLDELVKSLKGKAKRDVYYGTGLPFQDREHPPFMLGMGYILSWDLVEWIASSEITRNEPNGIEDTLTGKWLNSGDKARVRYNMFPKMYDYRGGEGKDFEVETIAVHQLKEDLRLVRTLKHFNVTTGLKASKLYHIS